MLLSSLEGGASLMSLAHAVGWTVIAPLALALTLLSSHCGDLVPAPRAQLAPWHGVRCLVEHQRVQGRSWERFDGAVVEDRGHYLGIPNRDQLRLLWVCHPGVAELDLGLQQ